ncbi:MAG: flavodoxin [Desulfobacter sp.]|nr:MAG: flavodoxin [Desulfobacter sp.]
MSKALIIYGSTTGNTEFTAETIESVLSDKGYEVTLTNVTDAEAGLLNDPYDLYLLGASTWGDAEIEFQEDFEPFYDSMNNAIDLTGKAFAIFGCGDSSYTYFCGAVDALEDRVSKLGGKVICESLRIDGEPEEEEIDEWTQDVTNAA